VTSAQLTCIRCQSTMQEGFLIDRGDGNLGKVGEWVGGVPESGFWSGVKTKGRDRFPVKTFRCTRCGYLESYATGTPS